MQEELDAALKRIKSRKAAGLIEIPPEVWKIRKFVDFIDYATLCIKKTQQRNGRKVVSSLSPRKANSESLRTTEAIATKVIYYPSYKCKTANDMSIRIETSPTFVISQGLLRFVFSLTVNSPPQKKQTKRGVSCIWWWGSSSRVWSIPSLPDP